MWLQHSDERGVRRGGAESRRRVGPDHEKHSRPLLGG